MATVPPEPEQAGVLPPEQAGVLPPQQAGVLAPQQAGVLPPEERARVLEALAAAHPDAATELAYGSPFELLVAVMLSAQTTDKRVNMVTPGLFARLPDPAALAHADAEREVLPLVASVNFAPTKARHLVAMARLLLERHGGEVPRARAALEALPGVGRKTASVVLSTVFDEPAIAVDTHVFRVSNRIGLANAPDVAGVERDLCRHIPREDWSRAHHWLILHGRYTCKALRPACERCPLTAWCLWYRRGQGEPSSGAETSMPKALKPTKRSEPKATKTRKPKATRPSET